MFQVSRCSAPVAILPDIWQPSIFIEHLKDKRMGAIDILELNSTEDRFNVNTKSFLDITISCLMNFAKFPFDNQKCTFKMILDIAITEINGVVIQHNCNRLTSV